jgi:benzoylformate decarboxylase
VWFEAVDAIPEGCITVQIEESAERLAFNFPLAVGAVGQLGVSLALLAAGVVDAADADFRAASQDRNRRLEREKAAKQEALAARARALRDVTPMSPSRAMHEIGRALPEDAVIVDESVTALLEVALSFRLEQPGDYYAARGGGIGQGVAGALGVKAAQPDRPVVALSGDGAAMYSIQALWTAAHHGLDILFVVISNREYRVLKHNLDTYRERFDAGSDRPYPHMDLGDPVLGFVEMARGMGVQGKLVSTPQELHAAVEEAVAAGGPYLLDVVVAGKR